VKEYTLLAVVSVLVTIAADNFFKVGIIKNRGFLPFLGVIIFFKFLMNGFLTGHKIVCYSPDFFLGIRIGSIPLEDFLFGFSMVTLTILFWEMFLGRRR
jgi:lycopene cyclase domain-containing protein